MPIRALALWSTVLSNNPTVGDKAVENDSQNLIEMRDAKVGDNIMNVYRFQMQKCKYNNEFTIHGLWPEWDQYCHGENFDLHKIGDVQDRLSDEWPSCVGHHGNSWLWSHEWKRHGTCSGMEQHEFFRKALDLHNEYKDKCWHSSNVGSNVCYFCFDKETWKQTTCPHWSPLEKTDEQNVHATARKSGDSEKIRKDHDETHTIGSLLHGIWNAISEKVGHWRVPRTAENMVWQ